MKARLPFDKRKKMKDLREYMMWCQVLYSCWTLNKHFGFGKERLMRFISLHGQDMANHMDMNEDRATNDTWDDEVYDWGKKMGLNDLIKGG